MGQTKPLYLMISQTDGRVGKVIRRFTHYTYNHVSLTLDPTFRSWVSFARYYCNVPLYGGFIHESAERYLARGNEVPIRLFRVDIPPERYHHLERIFSQAGDPRSGIIYNTFDALASASGRQVRLPDAYTCLSFACAVLGLRFRSIREMDQFLEPNLIYEGDYGCLAEDCGDRDDPYFTQLGKMHSTWVTLLHFSRLLKRIFRFDRSHTFSLPR